MIKIAVCKGFLFGPSVELLGKIGLDVSMLQKGSRRLVEETTDGDIRYIICRPSDIPVFVEYGAADLGMVGKDVLEERRKNVYELLDLGFGKCKLVLAEPAASYVGKQDAKNRFDQKRVATKFPNMTQNYFTNSGAQVEIIRLHGNIELAPAVGLAEQIVDLVATGKTLKENNLTVVDEIMVSTARLIANRASLKLNFTEINSIVEKLRSAL